MKLSDFDRMQALAYLHSGKSPREVSELMETVSYPQALRLSRELAEAKLHNRVLELFNLDQMALDNLLEAVKENLGPAVSALTGDLLPLEEAVDKLGDDIKGMQILKGELQRSATTLVKTINRAAATTNNPESIVMMAKALAELQSAFFKSNNINMINQNNLGPGSAFEEVLRDI